MPDESFPQLARAAQAGDTAARELLFSRAARLVYARAYRAVGDFEAASDIAQDALIRAVVGLPQLREPASFLSWLRSIVDRTVAAHHRRAGRERAEAVGEVLHAQAESTPEEAAHVRMAADEVRRAMAALFYYEGMTCAEVAEFLRVSRDAVKTTLSRSRKRVRRSVMAVTTVTDKPTRITTSMVSGEHHSEGPLFPHDSDIARFYLALYPRRAADKAASEAEVTRDRAQEIITFLEERRLIAAAAEGGRREDGAWRCTMPVVSDVDLEILKPWGQEAVAVVTGQLDDLHAQIAEITEAVPGEQACQTVLAAALFSEAETLPLQAIHAAMHVTAPERGEFGKYLAAVSTAPRFPSGFNGHISSAHDETDYGEFRSYYLHPVGTNRSDVQEFMRRFNIAGGSRRQYQDAIRELFRFLFSLAASPAGTDEAAARVSQCGIETDDPTAFLDELQRLCAIYRVGGSFEVAMPVVPMKPWGDYMARLTAMGKQVAETMGENADELRSRIMRCSFAQCNFADAVAACVMYLRGLIGNAIRDRAWVRLPEKADFSWGCMLVC